MTGRVRFITHQSKQILVIDMSNCSPDEVNKIFRTIPDLVTIRPLGSVLILSDFPQGFVENLEIFSRREFLLNSR